MGLSLEVGILADLRENDEEGYQHFCNQFDALNTHLNTASLPLHTEPADCEVWSCDMFGYSGLHYLRRIAAHLDSTGQLPQPGNDNASEDPVLKQYFEHVIGRKPSLAQRIFAKQPGFLRAFDHLIVHSDAEGFYLPIEFSDVLYPAGGCRRHDRLSCSSAERVQTNRQCARDTLRSRRNLRCALGSSRLTR